MRKRRKRLNKEPKKELTIDNLKKLVIETYHRQGKKGRGIWYTGKYIEVLEWTIPFFKNYDIWKLWKDEKQALRELGFGMRKENGHYKLFYNIDKMVKLKVHGPRQSFNKEKRVLNPCPCCEEQVVHPRLYYYECSNPGCDFAYTIDPSDPNKENQIKHSKKNVGVVS
ncbi:MAG: hypothetical protein ACFFAS_20370 [Promethearchaeota archaeon]